VSNESRLLPVALFVPVAVGVFAEGGFSAGARIAFGVTAMCAGAVAIRQGPARAPVVLVLLALAAVGALSALWTLGPTDRTLRWALVSAGYAAVAVAAGAVARRRRGVELIAGAIAVIAVGTGLAALVATALHEPPYAQRWAWVWRPAGPFEYPPALALLQVSALPALLPAVTSRRRRLAAAGAAGLAVAAAVLVLAGSRLSLAMAVVVAGLWLARRRGVRLRVAAPAVVVIAVLAGALAFGSGGGDVLHGRGSTWRAAVATFADQPLTGTGADAFLAGSARHQGGQTILFAHDLPLELAAELGIAGIALAIALYATAGMALWRSRGTSAGRLLGPAAAAFLAASLLDWPWHLAGSGAIWALSIGALTGDWLDAENCPPQNGPLGETS
jgi:O-antigen ligase